MCFAEAGWLRLDGTHKGCRYMTLDGPHKGCRYITLDGTHKGCRYRVPLQGAAAGRRYMHQSECYVGAPLVGAIPSPLQKKPAETNVHAGF